MSPQYKESLLQNPSQDNYRLLRIYAWYRALLASLLLGMFFVGAVSNVLGRLHPELYGYTVELYTLTSFVTLGWLLFVRRAPTTLHIFVVCLIDILLLTMIMYCSGGIATGLGSLIFITVAASSIFLRGQIATLLAALACIAILMESLVSGYFSQIDINPLAVALLGLLLFVTSILFQYLTRRILASQQAAAEQAAQAATLQKLNEMIVQRMYTGIVVLDGVSNILLYNEAAARLLYLPVKIDARDHLYFGSNPVLQNVLQQWIDYPQQRPQPLQLEQGSPEIQLNFARMENSGNDLVLVFVEDTRHMSQRAQQLKLASLGHLTASIAHEVRNPLGAISHAAQLLGESEGLPDADRRLAAIIQNHSLRVNRIIENVLQLSRRQAANPEKRDLCEWLMRFTQQHSQTYGKPIKIDLLLPDCPMQVYFDFSQLEQVVGNLCSNGLRYSEKATGQASITLQAYMHGSLAIPCLDIIDYGEGISNEEKKQIFEPFFTTDIKGTGLGLYIARELCLANQASLDYKRTSEGFSCFQISFPHSNKMMM
ncbi:MAG TPA: ATP-binding protein [Pseudomonadales bacterium]|nr:ATP-binding protein [Pseudomonadales bacterium]